MAAAGVVARPVTAGAPRFRAFAGPVGPAEREAANKLNEEERDDGKSDDVDDDFHAPAPSPRPRRRRSWSAALRVDWPVLSTPCRA